MEIKVFNDLVHGHMMFHPLISVVIDTRQLQRLRNLKQLGGCYFIFPSASHNRFEHCLGTAHIAGKLFDSLRQKRNFLNDDEKITWEKNKLCVQIAGLCHDVGHGPFSHTWEKFRRRVDPDDNWSHELESIMIFDELLNEKISPTKNFNGQNLETVKNAFEYYGLNSSHVELIKKMILGNETTKNYLFQIISNKNNDIDVDKWDYLARDSVMLNVPVGFDYRRLLNFCQILKNDDGEEEICYREKECSVIIEMFLSRGRLHDKAYQHIKVKIVEEMLIDAFVLANDRLKLTETPITELTDHIFQKILYEKFDDENMLKAKNILRRIESRNFYKCIVKESFEGEIPNFKLIYQNLKSVPNLKPYINDLLITSIHLDMTVSNKEKALKNVLVYRKEESKDLECKKFDWCKYQDPLTPNLAQLKRHQILILYKGEKELLKSLKEELKNHVQRILVDLLPY
ncbi:SAM domain and HD domain-containing protein, putative [Pediculus humanus corporis]|uniref:SAM domain and HD domain-containing protein, putative n=1 Tax=Pediculus humanus subsp. corporis TaxID=121224 RepID=E0VLQ9_PEDHC|nr:SAM domain and HD domain-containing protein, putative [Pediculus humanus corporis]EEB14315.1 SAM domain and HD domain-containing protein, putative [Pediculus humanus corporis]